MIEFRPALVQTTMITTVVLFLGAAVVLTGIGGVVLMLRLVALGVMLLCAAYVWQVRRLLVQVEPGVVRVRSWRAWREYRRDEAVAVPSSMRMLLGQAESVVLRRSGQRLGGFRIALDDFPKEDRVRLEDAILGALRSTHDGR